MSQLTPDCPTSCSSLCWAATARRRLATYQQTGSVPGATGGGRIAAATRFDLAGAAASVLADGDHAGRVYELSGEPFTSMQLADAVTAVTGRDVTYRDVPLAEFRPGSRTYASDRSTAPELPSIVRLDLRSA